MLSPKERACAELLAADLRMREIAKRLQISPSTVSTHITRARHKLGCRTTIGLAVAVALHSVYPEIEYLSWSRR